MFPCDGSPAEFTNAQPLKHLSTFIVKPCKLGHMWHSAQCRTPETGQHWSLVDLCDFPSSPGAVWQAYWSRTNAVKKLHHPPCAFVWWKACCEQGRELRTPCFCYVAIENCQSCIYLIIHFWPFLTSCHDYVRHLSAVTSRVPEEALRMGIFQQRALDFLVLHHSSIIPIPCK